MPNRFEAFISGRLSMAARLWTLSLVFCAPILLLTGLFIAQSWKDISFALKEQRGNDYERVIWPLFEAAATGKTATAADQAQFETARARFDPKLGAAATAERLDRATDPAERIAAGRDLLSMVSDRSNLTLDPDLDSFYMIVAVAFRLPPMLQATSELRGAVALPQSDPARAVRIAESLQTLRNSAAAANEDLRTGMSLHAPGPSRNAILAHAAALKRLADRVSTHRDALMAGAPIASVEGDLSALAAEDDHSWRAANTELQNLLADRIARLGGLLLVNLAMVALSLGLAAALAAAIAGGIAHRTRALVSTMDRLIAGDLGAPVPYLEDRNEEARIAQTIQAFKESQIEARRLRQEAAQQAEAAEHAKAAAEAERARVVRFLSVGELASTISHEINQPIAAIVAGAAAAARWLGQAPPNVERAQLTIARIAADGERTGAVIQRIRRMFSQGAPVLVEVDINDVAQEALACVERERTVADAVVRASLAPNLPTVRGDRIQLQQVIINLALNGVDAMKTVTDRPRALTLTTGVDGEGQVMVSVEDRGEGFGPDGAARLFDPFYTTKQHGMGLGLSISRSIIEHHGGRIWAESAPSGGAILRFTLQPWAASSEAAPTAAQRPRRAARRHTPHPAA